MSAGIPPCSAAVAVKSACEKKLTRAASRSGPALRASGRRSFSTRVRQSELPCACSRQRSSTYAHHCCSHGVRHLLAQLLWVCAFVGGCEMPFLAFLSHSPWRVQRAVRVRAVAELADCRELGRALVSRGTQRPISTCRRAHRHTRSRRIALLDAIRPPIGLIKPHASSRPGARGAACASSPRSSPVLSA
jgi:hypothetical protein